MADEESILDPEIERLSERLGKDPDSLVFAPLADAYRRSGLIEEAIDVLRKGMEKHPNYASAFIVLGRCYQDQKMYELARSEFEKALEVDRDNLLASKLYAAVLVPLGRKDEALERYRRLLEVDPTNAEIQRALDDLASQENTQEEKRDIGGGGDAGMFGFGDLGGQERGSGAPSFGDIFPGPEPDADVPAHLAQPTADAAPGPGPSASELGGRSPFDFGSIPEESAEKTAEPEEDIAPPAFLEPSVIGESGASTSRHDLGGGTEDLVSEPTVLEADTEEVVLPKPTGKTAFTAPPGLDVSIGREIDGELAEIYSEHGFTDKAIRVYERLLEIDPGRDDYRKRLQELKGQPPAHNVQEGVFPSEILEPFSDTAREGEAHPQGESDEFSEAATPEGDQTISLSDLFSGGTRDSAPESPRPAREPERKKEEETKDEGQPKGGFDSFQSWLDGLGK